eukprot:GDKH01007151.1.p1 GENE.GDKH01007151.1~~GDKH01007151.1.p1  ORF type:complete len:149 (+),score=16.21 GDKH01007151.1:206-652(+)
MALRRSLAASHMKSVVTVWEMFPSPNFDRSVLPHVGASLKKMDEVGPNKVLRGTGVHGPERMDVFKHILWNRVRQRRPQRLWVPTHEEQQYYFREIVSMFWFVQAIIWVWGPWTLWARSYVTTHDHFPWTPARTDGTRGPGPLYWWHE